MKEPVSRHTLQAYLFLLPALIILLVFFAYPMLDAIHLAFHRFQLGGPREFVGLSNFRRIGSDELFLTALWNSCKYLVVVPVIAGLSFTLAVLVNQPLRGVKLFRAVYYIPVVTSMVVAGIAWKWLYHDDGLLNAFLSWFGVGPVHWLTQPETALPAVMWVTIWKGLGYYMVIFLAGLQAIPRELHEACEVDGATGFRKVIHLILPLMRPYLAVVIVVSSIAAWKVFDELYIMTPGGGPMRSCETLATYIYYQAFKTGYYRFGYASAMALVLMVIILIFSWFNVKFLYSEELKK
jgi:putative chitobiose transport system permease protein